MKIYFCGAIMGGREHLPVFQHVVSRLKSLGHVVLSQHVADPNVLEQEQTVAAREVYERDVGWLRLSDAVVAEVSTPSLGVGYEVACALQLGKPVLCLFREGLSISKMITGNSSLGLTVATYGTVEELDQHLDGFLKNPGRPRC